MSSRAEAATKAGRDAYWATAFRALGDVMHLVQDMGQPQHTRNEAHPMGLHGMMEETINAKILGTKVAWFGTGVKGESFLAPFDFSDTTYPIPKFASYRDFFYTANGLGLSNYSNKGFFTFDKNFGNSIYALPTSNHSAYTTSTVDTREFDVSVAEHYLKGSVADAYLGANREIAMTRESLLREPIEAFPAAIANTPPSARYTLDTNIVEQQAILHVPRAVAYSAGLLNHFFRGSMKISPTSDKVVAVLDHGSHAAFKKMVVRVRNMTFIEESTAKLGWPDPASGAGARKAQTMSGGKLVAVVRFHRDRSYQDDLTSVIGVGNCKTLAQIYGVGNEPLLPDATGALTVINPSHEPTRTTDCRDGEETIVVSAPITATLAPDEELEFSFDFGANPISLAGVDYSLQVVYRGQLGDEEDAIVSAYMPLLDPMFITRHNVYDYIAQDSIPPLNRNWFGQDQQSI